MSCCQNNTLATAYSDQYVETLFGTNSRTSKTYERLTQARNWPNEQTKEGFCGSCPRKNTTGMVVFIPGVF